MTNFVYVLLLGIVIGVPVGLVGFVAWLTMAAPR